MYRVRIINFVERTRDEWDYDHLWSALKVIKDIDIGPDRLHCPAISDSKFDTELFSLLTSGYVYAGKETSEFPEGEFMIALLFVTETGQEISVANTKSILNVDIPQPRKSRHLSEPGAGNYS